MRDRTALRRRRIFEKRAGCGQRNTLVSSKAVNLDPRAGLELGYKNLVYLRGGVGNAQQVQSFTGSETWKVQPSLAVGAAAWILAGGAHHTGYSQNLTAEYLEDFAEMAGIEYLIIDDETRLRTFKNELRYNDAAFGGR